MSSPNNVPPAPAPAPIPLPHQKQPTKKYSEGSMYEDLSPEDVEAWHRRYRDYKKWRQEISVKQVTKPKIGVNSKGGSVHLGESVGVGPADWNWREPSECGTIPTTIIERAWETARATTTSQLRPQAEPPAPPPPTSRISKKVSNKALKAKVETVDTFTTSPSQATIVVSTARSPLSERPLPPQNVNQSQPNLVKSKTPTTFHIEAQPPTSKSVTQKPLTSQKSPSQTVSGVQDPIRSHHGVLVPQAPSRNNNLSTAFYTTQKPMLTSNPTRPAPTPLLACPPSSAKVSQSVSESKVGSHHSSKKSALLIPGEQIVPSPTLSAKYAEREAYITSALSLPLDLLAETNAPPKVTTSSQLTTGRLDSLLGRTREGSKTKVSQRSAGSGTPPPSVRSETLPEKIASQIEGNKSQTARAIASNTVPSTSDISDHREHHYQSSNHLPIPIPGAPSARPKTSSGATILKAANQPLPPSAPTQSQISTMSVGSTKSSQNQSNIPCKQQAHLNSPAASEATVIRAAREPLPLSMTASSRAETIRIPVSARTAFASSGPPTRDASTEAIVLRANRIPPPVTTGQTGTQRSRASSAVPPQSILDSPRNVPLPSTHLTTPSAFTKLELGRTPLSHRRQMPLPRPALTPKSSVDGLTKSTSFGRRHRDPSVGDLTAHFEPSMYPLPPNGATLFSSPEPTSIIVSRAIDDQVVSTMVQTLPPPASVIIKTETTPQARSNRSIPPSPPGTRAAAILLPPSTAILSARSIPDTQPSAPAPSLASPPAPPPPLMTSPAQLIQPSSMIPDAAVQASSSSHMKSDAHLANDPVNSTSYRAPKNHPHIHFSPGQISRSLRSDDDHVSFEVPSGSRGRLRVTLNWLRDGGKSDRGSPKEKRLSIVDGERPPPLPAKTSSLMTRVTGRSKAEESQGKSTQTTYPADLPPQAAQSHPLAEQERLKLFPSPPKRESIKSPSPNDLFTSHLQQQQQQHHTGPAPFYNPYYSGATLPAYAAAMPQVYNMFSPPLTYPQPGLPTWHDAQYRSVQGVGQPTLPNDQSSPARESVDPPSDDDIPSPPHQLPHISQQNPPQTMGMDGHSRLIPQQRYWDYRNRNEQKPSMWQKMFRRPTQHGFGEDNLGPDDSVTVRNWRKDVMPGRAPTLVPQPGLPPRALMPQIGPTISPSGYLPNAHRNAPGTTLYNTRGAYSRRERQPNFWDKMIYTRPDDQTRYHNAPRRNGNLNLPYPAPRPPRETRSIFNTSKAVKENARSKIDRSGYQPILPIRKEEVGVKTSRRAGDERYTAIQREKEERRRQRAARRDERANKIVPYSTEKNGLRRDQFAQAGQQDRPIDLGGPRGGRSKTMIGDWVGQFGIGQMQTPKKANAAQNTQNQFQSPLRSREHGQSQALGRSGSQQKGRTIKRTRTVDQRAAGTSGANSNGAGIGFTRALGMLARLGGNRDQNSKAQTADRS
ncbi:uncharacterized protein IL334_007352 [Kwoniella shivajii]|uniref:Uncharacterized protein n=1 Tax=Kwoniella shivajii TaxID=564305 RepID=A0ABZ1DAP9_9TREE|nr:hypothetical protein IL334_007352 [Kwoniella shivajii]